MNLLTALTLIGQDIYSYDMEQAKGLAGLNMLTVLMTEMDCTLQDATDHAGRAFKSLLVMYERDKKCLRSWGPEIDAQVQDYLKGIEYWVIGNLHWSFESMRYFGLKGAIIKEKRIEVLRSKE